jgi:hypothetical protein
MGRVVAVKTRGFRQAGHMNWKRAALVAVPTALVSAVVIAGVAAGVVPVSLAVSPRALSFSGQTFLIAADRLDGHGFSQYVAVDHTRGSHPLTLSGIESADLHNLCQSVVADVGKVTLRITASGGDKPAHTDHLVVHTDDLAGDTSFQDIVIGQDASTLSGLSGAPPGGFGLQAASVHIDHLRQQATGVSAGTFQLNGLHMTVKSGANPCY